MRYKILRQNQIFTITQRKPRQRSTFLTQQPWGYGRQTNYHSQTYEFSTRCANHILVGTRRRLQVTREPKEEGIQRPSDKCRTFSPLIIISTAGGWGRECFPGKHTLFTDIQHSSQQKRRKMNPPNVLAFKRERIQFNLLRTTLLLSSRRNRQTQPKKHEQNLNYRIVDIDFNLVDISVQN